MPNKQARIIEHARKAKKESKLLDFKGDFDATSTEAWCEVIKDIVAFANSGGGIIVFGAENNGRFSGFNPQPLLDYDLADVVNKIHSYTGVHFSEIEIVSIKRGRNTCGAMVISASEVPIVFTKPGTYAIEGGRQTTAFARGTVYFRHGAKSEPGNAADMSAWRDRAVDRVKRSWMGDMRKVVQLPHDHTLTAVPRKYADGAAITAKLTSDVGGISIVPGNTEELWPHRQKDLLQVVNSAIKGSINGHDITCVNKNLNVFVAYREFAHKPHKLASPQYSDQYAQWLIAQAKKNPKFFGEMRNEYRKKHK